MILNIFHLQHSMRLTDYFLTCLSIHPEFSCSATMLRRQTDTQIPGSSRSCCIKETTLFLNPFPCTLSLSTFFASLAIIDTAQKKQLRQFRSPSTIITCPLETDFAFFQILSCAVSSTVAECITSKVISCCRTHSLENSASDM